jgi:hypothetical protein
MIREIYNNLKDTTFFMYLSNLIFLIVSLTITFLIILIFCKIVGNSLVQTICQNEFYWLVVVVISSFMSVAMTLIMSEQIKKYLK